MSRIWTVCLLLMFWIAQAWSQEPTSMEPSSELQMVPLESCLRELMQLEKTAQQQLTQLDQQWQERLTRLASDYEARLRDVAVEAAAEAARPLLVELAGTRAERDAIRAELDRYRTRTRWYGAAAIVAIIVVLIGWAVH